MEYQNIIYEVKNQVAIVRLNRPHRMNAVIEGMYQELLAAAQKAEADPDVRCLILTGSVRVKDGVEKQAFCAGADLKEHAKGRRSEADKRAYILLGQEVCRALYRFSKPTIAAINGPARGAGAEMALNCDFVFMAKSASLAFTETSLSTFIGGGVTMNLPGLSGCKRPRR
jgi:enoyl-CoA hydratase